jgi:hypothetical protein
MKMIEIEDRSVNPNLIVSVSKVKEQINVREMFTNAGPITAQEKTGKYEFTINILSEQPVVMVGTLEDMNKSRDNLLVNIAKNS